MSSGYLFGGLQIDAEPPLTRLWRDHRAPRMSADIEVTFAGRRPPNRGRRVFAWPGRFEMSLWRLDSGWVFRSDALDIDVAVSGDGRLVACHCEDPAATGLAEFLIRRVLPRLAVLHGRLTLHAAAVRGANGCLLLSGATGAGKSTLSTALALTSGWRLLSDDVSIIEPDGPCVWPSGPGAYLTPTSIAGLGLDATSGGPDPSHSGKAWFAAGDAVGEALPVAGVVFLNRTEPARPARLLPLPRPVALRRAWRQVIRLNPLDQEESARLFERLAGLVWRTPAFQLDYPADYAAIPSVDAELRRTWTPELAV